MKRATAREQQTLATLIRIRLFLVLLRATLDLGRAPELLLPVLALLAC